MPHIVTFQETEVTVDTDAVEKAGEVAVGGSGAIGEYVGDAAAPGGVPLYDGEITTPGSGSSINSAPKEDVLSDIVLDVVSDGEGNGQTFEITLGPSLGAVEGGNDDVVSDVGLDVLFDSGNGDGPTPELVGGREGMSVDVGQEVALAGGSDVPMGDDFDGLV